MVRVGKGVVVVIVRMDRCCGCHGESGQVLWLPW